MLNMVCLHRGDVILFSLLFLERKNIYEHVSKYQKMHVKSNLIIWGFFIANGQVVE